MNFNSWSAGAILTATLIGVLISGQGTAGGVTEDNSTGAEFFERSVRPLFAKHCFQCHGPKEEKSGLRLHTAVRLFQGGHTGPVVIPGQPEESRLIQLVRGGKNLRMPPDGELTPAEITTLQRWVAEGAVWPGYPLQPKLVDDDPAETTTFTAQEKSFWAFQPVIDPEIPAVVESEWIASPLDQFILAQLEAKGLRPAPRADRRTWLRRITFDLTGLPPTLEEIVNFLGDQSNNASAKVVDRLLDSPRYGERWGRHWLDVVRYAESAAHDGNNAYLHAWRYRDYVIGAFNEDKPYDQFLTEQLAGDLLAKTGDLKKDYEQKVATGFLQVGAKPVVMRDKRQMLLDIVDEQLNTTGIAFMGLTIGCARCHDHKFDPIPVKDYYALAGIFASTRVMADHLPDSKWIEEEIPGPDGKPTKVMTVRDFTNSRNLRIHQRGNYRLLGPVAPRRFLQIIAGVEHPPIDGNHSGRLQLARWLASPDHPLTARVMINRIWQHHFGKGLVSTSDNFGWQGQLPTHPALLDWLASRFVESGWSLKAMHRLMLNSNTYQQAYSENVAAADADPNNQLLWRMPRRRLDAEELRDTLLAVSGMLDFTQGGTLFTEGYTTNDKARELFVVDISGKDHFPPFQEPRRSVYLPVIRNARPEMLKLFDVANSHEPTGSRGETTVAPQALFLLNSPFVRAQAEQFAERLLSSHRSPDDASDLLHSRIQQAYLQTLGRLASDDEVARAEEFLSGYQQVASKLDPAILLANLETSANDDSDFQQLVRRHESLLAYHHLRGIELNGVNQRLEYSSFNTLNRARSAITVECCIRPAEIRPYMMIVGRDGASQRYWKLAVYGKDVAGHRQNVVYSEFFHPQLGGMRLRAETPFVAPLHRWTYVAFTYGNQRRRLYINGDLVDEVKVTGDVPTGSTPLTIGSRQDDSEWFHGAIDHVAIYDSELDEGTLRRHYQSFQRTHSEATIDPVKLAAWRAFCQSLLCLNEFIYVD
ncbi:MAG: DUF1553 domain-containing protein [Pirellulales bacterium]